MFWLKDGVASDEQREQARTVGAQFRNSEFADEENLEEADYVMGDVPECYSDYKRFGAKKQHSSLRSSGGSTDTGATGNAASGGAQDDEDPEEIEVTVEYINGLLKADLIELAQSEEITLTGHEKVDELKDILLEHFELQE